MDNVGDKTQVDPGDDSSPRSSTASEVAPSTKRERIGWYLYDFSNGLVNSGVLIFALPLLLDFLAFDSGSSFPAVTLKPGQAASTLPDFAALAASNASWFQMGTCVAGNSSAGLDDQGYYARCVVPWAGGYVRHTTYALNVISVSVGVQAFFFIQLGSLADHGSLRKLLLLIFAAIGILSTILFIIPTGRAEYWVAGLLTIVLNVAFGVAGVFYNAFLPLLTKADPEILAMPEEDKKDAVVYQKKSEDVSNKLSTNGYAFLYAAGGLGAAIIGLIVLQLGQPMGLRVGTLVSGVWWAVFMIPFVLWGKPRPGPPLPKGENYIIYPWKQLYRLLRSIPQIPRTFIFLLCYWAYSDGYGTIVNVAILFAQSELHVSDVTLVMLVIITPIAASLGNLTFLYVQRRFGTSAKSCIITCLTLYSLISIYGILGLIPSNPLGFKTASLVGGISWELFAFAVYHGFLLGPTHSYTRVIFAELIPPGREAEFFSFYEITNRGSSWMGPLIVGALNQSGGTLRLAFIYLLIVFAVPIPVILFLVDIVKGKKDAYRASGLVFDG